MYSTTEPHMHSKAQNPITFLKRSIINANSPHSQVGPRLVSVPDPKPTPARITFSIAPARYTGSDIHAG